MVISPGGYMINHFISPKRQTRNGLGDSVPLLGCGGTLGGRWGVFPLFSRGGIGGFLYKELRNCIPFPGEVGH